MRVYISGPITGTPGYRKHFQRAEAGLREQGHEVINPAKNELVMPKSTTHDEYMRICLQQVECCDAICMLEGWKASSGAREEFCYAVDRNMIIFFEGGKENGNTKQRNRKRNSNSVRGVSILWPATLIRRINRHVRRGKNDNRHKYV